MGVYNGLRYSDSDPNEIRLDVSEFLNTIDPYEVPTLQVVGPASTQTPVTQLKHEWNERKLRSQDSTLNGAINTVVTAVVVAAGDGKLFNPGDIVKVDAELMAVASVATDTLTVVRANGGSTAASHSSGAAIAIIANAQLENASSFGATSATSDRLFNYGQLMVYPVRLSRVDQTVQKYTVGNDLAVQLSEAMKSAMIALERALIHGRRVAPVGGSVAGQMDGLLARISTNVYAKAGALLAFDDIRTAARDSWSKGGRISHIICNSFQKERINTFLDSQRQTTRTDRTAGDMVNTIETDYGIHQIVLDRNVPKDTVLLIQKDLVGVGPLVGGKDWTLHAERRTDMGPLTDEWDLLGLYTTEIRHEYAHAAISGLAIS